MVIAIPNIAATRAIMFHRRKQAEQNADETSTATSSAHLPPKGKATTLLILAALVLFQATNATAMTFLTIYVTETVGLPIIWAGIVLGLAAALEVPA